MDILRQLEAEQVAKIEAKRKLPEFQPGDTVRVQVRVTEGTRTRVQAYEGVVIARAGAGFQENFTVRKISYGEGVERVFPVYSPMIEGVEIVRRGKVRRAKLYYLRDRRGKSARISENTGVRARKLNDDERDALNAEKARIEADMALQVNDILAREVADLAGFQRMQGRTAGQHGGDAIAARGVGRMQFGAIVPIQAVGIEERFHSPLQTRTPPQNEKRRPKPPFKA